MLNRLKMAFVAASALALSISGHASITVYSGGGATIPGATTVGVAAPYPLTINAGAGTILDVDVALKGLSHTFPDDIEVLLVGPKGQSVLLMSDVGGGFDIAGIDLTFDDSAATSLPDLTQLASGSFKPTNIGAGDTFPAPAPAGPYGSTLSVFNGLDAAGTWSLYIVDDLPGDVGSLAGWELRITSEDSTASVPEPGSPALVGLATLAAILVSGRRRRA